MYAHVCTYQIKYVKTKLIQAFMHALATLQDWRMKVLEWQISSIVSPCVFQTLKDGLLHSPMLDHGDPY